LLPSSTALQKFGLFAIAWPPGSMPRRHRYPLPAFDHPGWLSLITDGDDSQWPASGRRATQQRKASQGCQQHLLHAPFSSTLIKLDSRVSWTIHIGHPLNRFLLAKSPHAGADVRNPFALPATDPAVCTHHQVELPESNPAAGTPQQCCKEGLPSLHPACPLQNITALHMAPSTKALSFR